MTAPTTWIVAYDFSDLAKSALEKAERQLSGLGGGRIIIAHVHVPATDGAGIDLGTLGPGFVQSEQAVLEATERALADLIAGLPPVPGVTREHRILVGRPADKIVDLAVALDADQIVIGSHGRRGFERLLLGSVAERMLRLADRPVLVVKKVSSK